MFSFIRKLFSCKDNPSQQPLIHTDSLLTYDYNKIEEYSLLIKACQENDYNKVEEYLLLTDEHPSDNKHRDELDNTPLHIACFNCNYELVCLLLEYDADVTIINVNGDTPLHTACYQNHLSIINILLNENANPFLKNVLGKNCFNIANDFSYTYLPKLLHKNNHYPI